MMTKMHSTAHEGYMLSQICHAITVIQITIVLHTLELFLDI